MAMAMAVAMAMAMTMAMAMAAAGRACKATVRGSPAPLPEIPVSLSAPMASPEVIAFLIRSRAYVSWAERVVCIGSIHELRGLSIQGR